MLVISLRIRFEISFLLGAFLDRIYLITFLISFAVIDLMV